jgi:hypothetical protein
MTAAGRRAPAKKACGAVGEEREVMQIADASKRRGPTDRKTVNLNEPGEVRWWCQRLGCTEERLKEAVKSVGTSSSKVDVYLKAL